MDSKSVIPNATLTALVRAAGAFSYEVGQLLKAENSDGARALSAVLTADPLCEIIASVRLSPNQHVVLAATVDGQPHIIFECSAAETPGAQH